MKRLMIVAVMMLFCCGGCAMLAQYGQDPNNVVVIDPNQIDALVNAGHAVQAIGITLGRPELAGLGILIATIGAAVAIALKKKQ